MSKLNEFFFNNKQTISFVMMLSLLIIMIIIFIYFRQNVEYIKMNPCDYCMNKTKFTCVYYGNSFLDSSKKEVNLTIDEIKQLNSNNYSSLFG